VLRERRRWARSALRSYLMRNIKAWLEDDSHADQIPASLLKLLKSKPKSEN
jgi:hypothetical protein